MLLGSRVTGDVIQEDEVIRKCPYSNTADILVGRCLCEDSEGRGKVTRQAEARMMQLHANYMQLHAQIETRARQRRCFPFRLCRRIALMASHSRSLAHRTGR